MYFILAQLFPYFHQVMALIKGLIEDGLKLEDFLLLLLVNHYFVVVIVLLLLKLFEVVALVQVSHLATTRTHHFELIFVF